MEDRFKPRLMFRELDDDAKASLQLPEHRRYWNASFPSDCDLIDEDGLTNDGLSVLDCLFESLYDN